MPGFRILWSEYTKDNELTIFTKTSKRILIMKRLHWLFFMVCLAVTTCLAIMR